MNPISEIAVPGYESPAVLLLVAFVALVAGLHLLISVNTSQWGLNRLLYVLSGGSPAIGHVMARIPGLLLIGVAFWLVGRIVGFL